MLARVCIYVTIATCITNLANSAPADEDQNTSTAPSTTRNIYKPAKKSKVTDIKNNNTPWVMSEFVPIMEEYKKNVFADLEASPQVQKIYDLKYDSETIRDIFFKLDNKFLSEIKHPVPAALANIVSKCTSLFDSFTMPIFFEAIAFNQAAFLLTHNIKIDRGTSQSYVDLLSMYLDKADLSDVDSLWRATLDAYSDFFESFEFKILDIVDEVFELFASELIVLHDK